jgi:hypothetical protein
MWTNEVSISVLDYDHHFIFATCIIKSTNQQFGLICIYGNPHHRSTNVIWDKVFNFVTQNISLPMFCLGDMNELIHGNEKLGPTRANANRINAFCAYVKHCGFFDLGYNGPAYTWTNNRFSSIPLMKGLIDVCLMQNGVCYFPPQQFTISP